MDKSRPLPKAGTVAYLLGHAGALALAGVFGKDLAATAVFKSWCEHPDGVLTFRGYETAESMPVDPDFAGDPKKISSWSTVPVSTVYKKLVWLREMRLISGGPGTNERPVILSVNKDSEIARNNEFKPFSQRESNSHSETIFSPRESHARPLSRRRP